MAKANVDSQRANASSRQALALYFITGEDIFEEQTGILAKARVGFCRGEIRIEQAGSHRERQDGKAHAAGNTK